MRTMKPTRRIRKCYTLSAASIAFIEEEKKARGLRSASAALDALLRDGALQSHMTDIAASISNYYDSLSEEETREGRLWGAFAETQFPLE